MNNLFQFNKDFEIEVSPEALTITPFKKVMEKYTNRYHGILELTFIGFLLNPKSDFADIRDEEKRKEAILLSIDGLDKIKIDKVTQEAISYYKSRVHTTTTLYLDAALNAIDKLTHYFDDVDFNAVDDRGNPMYDPKKLVDVIAASPKLMASVRELKDQIQKEQELETGVRGSGQKGVYEDE